MITTGCLPSRRYVVFVVVPFLVMSLISMHVTSKWVHHNREIFGTKTSIRTTWHGQRRYFDRFLAIAPLDVLLICEWFGVSEGCVPARHEQVEAQCVKFNSF